MNKNKAAKTATAMLVAIIMLFAVAGLAACDKSAEEPIVFFSRESQSGQAQEGTFVLTKEGEKSWNQWWRSTNQSGADVIMPNPRWALYLTIYEGQLSVLGVNESDTVMLPLTRTGNFYTAQEDNRKVLFLFDGDVLNARFENIRTYGARDFQFSPGSPFGE